MATGLHSRTTSRSSSGCSTWICTPTRRDGRSRRSRNAIVTFILTAERIEIPFENGTQLVGNLRRPRVVLRRSCCSSRARLTEGGVLRLAECVPRPRPRDVLPRRPRAGERPASRRASIRTTRRPRPRRSTRSQPATTSTSSASASPVSASAATTPRGRPRTRNGSRPPSGSAVHSTSASAGRPCRSRRARPSRTTHARPPTTRRRTRRRSSTFVTLRS